MYQSIQNEKDVSEKSTGSTILKGENNENFLFRIEIRYKYPLSLNITLAKAVREEKEIKHIGIEKEGI